MRIKAITIENFKSIGEPVRVEFKPLTLLFGPNSAGKSTIIQALHYIREVLSSVASMSTKPFPEGSLSTSAGLKILFTGMM